MLVGALLKKEKVLDAILSYLRIKTNERFMLAQILSDINVTVDEDAFQDLESRLVNSEYVVTKIISHSRKIFSINDKGIQFINDGGFTKEKIWKTVKNAGEIINIFK